jgi:hypothetical protein
VIRLTLAPHVRPAALFALQKVILRHRDVDGEPVEVSVGERKIHLGVEMRVSATSACMEDLMLLLDTYGAE